VASAQEDGGGAVCYEQDGAFVIRPECYGGKKELGRLNVPLGACSICRLVLTANTIMPHILKRHPEYYHSTQPESSYLKPTGISGVWYAPNKTSAAHLEKLTAAKKHHHQSFIRTKGQTSQDALKLRKNTHVTHQQRSAAAAADAPVNEDDGRSVPWASWSQASKLAEAARITTTLQLYMENTLFNTLGAEVPTSYPDTSAEWTTLNDDLEQTDRWLQHGQMEGVEGYVGNPTCLPRIVAACFTTQVVSWLMKARESGEQTALRNAFLLYFVSATTSDRSEQSPVKNARHLFIALLLGSDCMDAVHANWRISAGNPRENTSAYAKLLGAVERYMPSIPTGAVWYIFAHYAVVGEAARAYLHSLAVREADGAYGGGAASLVAALCLSRLLPTELADETEFAQGF
jgi:hypothetical protein